MRQRIRAGEVPDLIRKTAEEFAGVFYDGGRTAQFRLARTEYGLTEKAYVRRYWYLFVDPAIQVLSAMLAQPGVEEAQKLEIFDAITAFHNTSTIKLKPQPSMRSLH